jgi:hypothetical protein
MVVMTIRAVVNDLTGGDGMVRQSVWTYLLAVDYSVLEL